MLNRRENNENELTGRQPDGRADEAGKCHSDAFHRQLCRNMNLPNDHKHS